MVMAIAPLGHGFAKIVLCLTQAKPLLLVGRDLCPLKCKTNSWPVIGWVAAVFQKLISALGVVLFGYIRKLIE
jgi:hypothetical protein